MKGLAEFVLSLCDLAEAEGRLLRDSARRTCLGCGLIAIGLVFVGIALAFIVASLYEILAVITAPPVAFLILAAVCAFFALILLWLGKKCMRTKTKKPHQTP